MNRVILIAAAAAMFALLAYWRLEPGVDAARARLDEARSRLRSDALVFAARPRLIAERQRLLPRYGASADGATESQLLRILATASKRFGVEFVSGSVAASAPLDSRQPYPGQADFDELRLAVELRGSYRGLLMTIDDVTRNADLIRVDGASLRTNGPSIDAAIPITLLRPHRSRS
jgi:hypothetical protein